MTDQVEEKRIKEEELKKSGKYKGRRGWRCKAEGGTEEMDEVLGR
jgi:hypothetical protein